jgi:hypothetical protein
MAGNRRSIAPQLAAAAVALVLGAPSAPAMARQAPAIQIPLFAGATHSFIPMRVESQPPVLVMFDTGTSELLISTEFGRRIGLRRTGPADLTDGATGLPVPGYASILPKAAFGPVTLERLPVTVVDTAHPYSVGIVGLTLFSGRLVELDLGARRVVLRDKTAGAIPTGPAEPYLGDGDDALPAATIGWGDRTIRAYLDSGNNNALSFPLEMAGEFKLKAPPQPAGRARSSAGEQQIYRATLDGELVIGPLRLTDPVLTFTPHAKHPNIGAPLLARLKLVFDPAERRTWIVGSDRS